MARADRLQGLTSMMSVQPPAYAATTARPAQRTGAALAAAALVTSLVLASLAAPTPAQAQSQGRAPAGSPSDVRYTTPAPGDAALYPRAPGTDAQAPQLLRAEQSGNNYAANAAVGRILVDVDRDAVPADGQSPVKLTLKLLGKDGKPLTQRAYVTIEHSGGRILLPGARTDEQGPRGLDADRGVPGMQIVVDNGQAEFTLLAPAEAQDVRLRITAGAEEALGVISFVPELRPLVAAGLVEGIINFRNKGRLNMVRRGDGFEQDIERWSREFNGGKANAAGRAAFFIKGTIRGDLLLTAAYDSDKATRARLLRDVRPDELYPVYGDSSLRSFDARSGDRLYVRIDKNKSYALYGDFVTGDGFSQPIGQGAVASLKQRSLGNVNRSATGVRLHQEQGGLTGNVYASRDTLRQMVDEIASQGSGPYGLRNNGVLEGSEKVEVLVRDRQQPARIISVRPLTRLVDYSFEPFSGRILLASFLPSQDENLNPVTLRVTYEVDQGGSAFWVMGGDAQWRINPTLEVGGSVLKDKNPLAPYDLASANATVRINPGTALVIEGARSSSTVNTNPANQTSATGLAGRTGAVAGRAARVELAHEGESTDARVALGRSSPLFNNPGAPLAGGRDELYAGGGLKLAPGLKLYGEGVKSKSRNPGGADRSQVGLGLRWLATERLTFDASIRRLRETTGAAGNGLLTWPFDQTAGLTSSLGSGSAGGALGYGQQVVDPATGLPVIQQGGLASTASSLPAGTRLASDTVRLGAGYRVTDRTSLGAEVEADVNGDRRRRIAAGADYQLGERTRLYGRFERQSGWVQLGGESDTGRRSNVFVLGVDTSVLPDTQAFSEYRLRDAIAGRDLQLASGIRNNWQVAEGWRINTAYENLRVVSGSSAPVNAISVAVDWSADALWRAATKLERRVSGDIAGTPDNERFSTTLWQALVARKLSRDWTLLARNHLLKTTYAARGGVLQDRAQVGVAYRDTDRNRSNALAVAELKNETDASNAAVGELKSRALVLSVQGDYHPSRPWWLSGRAAAKWQRDRFEGGTQGSFQSQLLSARLVYDIDERWDIGLLGAVQFGGNGARQTAYGAEVGYLLQPNLWLSAGVNAAGFNGDADLVGYEYTRRGAYIRLRFKFDENLFKGRDREVNRSLDR